jgi:KDO2-lipid IV(A) lauroyltransferase
MIPSARAVRVGIALAATVPAPALRAVARAAGRLAGTLPLARCATVRENLVRLAPSLGSAERERAVRRTFGHLLEAAVELWRLPSLATAHDAGRSLDALVAIEGRAHLDEALAMGRGVIAVTPHLGPYELGGAVLARHGYPVHAVVERLDDETLAALAQYRAATGMGLVARDAGARPLLRLLRDGQVVLLVADRVVGGGDGLAVPFGTGRRLVPTGPAALALASGAPLLVGSIARSPAGPARYTVRLEPALHPVRTGDAARDRETITHHLAARLAALAGEHPEQWFVFQPEWLPSERSADR